jgi:hypothetical protein
VCKQVKKDAFRPKIHLVLCKQGVNGFRATHFYHGAQNDRACPSTDIDVVYHRQLRDIRDM